MKDFLPCEDSTERVVGVGTRQEDLRKRAGMRSKFGSLLFRGGRNRIAIKYESVSFHVSVAKKLGACQMKGTTSKLRSAQIGRAGVHERSKSHPKGHELQDTQMKTKEHYPQCSRTNFHSGLLLFV